MPFHTCSKPMSQTMKTFIQFVSDKEPLRNAVDESTRCIIGIAEYEAIQQDAFRAGEISGMERAANLAREQHDQTAGSILNERAIGSLAVASSILTALNSLKQPKP